ncbi:hydrogenase subunit MbhD domain-containing protein [Porphyrobacter sp. GA68]|uniref:hydrogenase subunit MbhD domain-containing protein n=1 Tax=Porphyrobacter sp. GA68 TaxID=2883480 RepID=UPI001D18FCC1|nr:hydrogenase subunit MbhD domain-containing protein [Porphyrobacter sp. GA68]
MTLGDAFDILLCLLILTAAAGVIGGRDLFGSVALFIVYGLLLTIAWVRLGAVDVALAEGAIGAGLTGVLLLGAAAKMDDGAGQRPSFRPGALLLCAGVAGGLGWAVVSLAQPAAGLIPLVRENLPVAGADNPVTAVLLNFRGWDTLMEAAVLLIALVGVWALSPEDSWGGRSGLTQRVRVDGVLGTFGRFLPPIGFVVGVYLVWVGTSAPGGAFQGGTVVAAVWLLAIMAGVVEPPPVASIRLRLLLMAGPAVFLATGIWGFAAGAFMAFDPAYAKPLILAVELVLALSIAATLALLVIGRPRRPQ